MRVFAVAIWIGNQARGLTELYIMACSCTVHFLVEDTVPDVNSS